MPLIKEVIDEELRNLVPFFLTALAAPGLLDVSAQEILGAVRFEPAGELTEPADNGGEVTVQFLLADQSVPSWMTGRDLYPPGLRACLRTDPGL